MSPEPSPPKRMTVYDAYGRRFEIDREEWRRRVLPENLRNSWSDAAALFQTIVTALDDGFEREVMAAAAHLYEIEESERAVCVLAIVFMKNLRSRDAEEVLSRYIEKHGESGLVLTNLAKVQWDDKAPSKAMATLWRGIKLDPNQENGLLWYAAIHRERGGDAGYAEALQRAAELPGSWRAKLWLARRELEQQRFETARKLYEDVLVVAADQPGVLTQISGDLGERGFVREIIDIILPFYDPERHDVSAGLNCLQAFLDTRDWKRGEELLHRLMSLHMPPVRERLLWYSSQFEALKAPAETREPIEDVSIELVALDDPVWCIGLNGAQWLLPPPLPTGRRVALLALANTTAREAASDDEVLAGREDDVGRLTRSIPLYLADMLRFRTDAQPTVLLPIVPGRAMAVFGGEWDAEAAKESGAELVVSGSIARTSDGFAVKLVVLRDGKPLETIEWSERDQHFEPMINGCESGLIRALVSHNAAIESNRAALFRVPYGGLRSYLDGFGQALALGLAASGALPPSMLFGERHILRWFLDLALAMPGAPIPRIMLIAGLANSRRCGFKTYIELQRETMTLFSALADDDPVTPLMPLVYRLFDMNAEFEESRGKMMMRGGDEYVGWLARLETMF